MGTLLNYQWDTWGNAYGEQFGSIPSPYNLPGDIFIQMYEETCLPTITEALSVITKLKATKTEKKTPKPKNNQNWTHPKKESWIKLEYIQAMAYYAEDQKKEEDPCACSDKERRKARNIKAVLRENSKL